MHILIIPRIKDNEIFLDSSLYNKKIPTSMMRGLGDLSFYSAKSRVGD
jgi:hypothetical protein